MNTGDLTERVTIEGETLIPDGQGGFETQWAPIARAPNVWANVISQGGDEALNGLVERSRTMWRVTIRKRSDLTTKHRLVWGGLFLDILSATPHPKEPRSFTLVMCESDAG